MVCVLAFIQGCSVPELIRQITEDWEAGLYLHCPGISRPYLRVGHRPSAEQRVCTAIELLRRDPLLPDQRGVQALHQLRMSLPAVMQAKPVVTVSA